MDKINRPHFSREQWGFYFRGCFSGCSPGHGFCLQGRLNDIRQPVLYVTTSGTDSGTRDCLTIGYAHGQAAATGDTMEVGSGNFQKNRIKKNMKLNF